MEVSKEDHVVDLKLILGNHVDDIPKKGILHIGAHKGEEVGHYLELGFERIALIEPNPQWYRLLVERFEGNPAVQIFGIAVSDISGVMDFHIHTSQSGSTEPASLLRMKEFNKIVKTLRTEETIKVKVMTLDDFFIQNELSSNDYNFINIDVQGAELMAFKGATKTFETTDVIISEVNLVQLYENAPLENDILDYLSKYGYVKTNVVYHTLYNEKGTFPAWGECLLIKKSRMKSGHTIR